MQFGRMASGSSSKRVLEYTYTGYEDSHRSCCSCWRADLCQCGRRGQLLMDEEESAINGTVSVQSMWEDGIIFNDFFSRDYMYESLPGVEFASMDDSSGKQRKRKSSIVVTSVRDLSVKDAPPEIALEDIRISQPLSTNVESKYSKHSQPAQNGKAEQVPLLLWRDMDSPRVIGTTLGGYLQQSDVIVVSAKYTGDSYDTTVEVCRWLEEIEDTTLNNTETGVFPVVAVFIWGDERYATELKSFEKDISSIKSYLALKQAVHVTIAPLEEAENVFLQGVLNSTFSLDSELDLHVFSQSYRKTKSTASTSEKKNSAGKRIPINVLRASSWECFDGFPEDFAHFPRNKASGVGFLQDLNPKVALRPTYLFAGLISAATASLPWFAISWIRNKLVLSILDGFSQYFCGDEKPSRRFTTRCRLCCFLVARKTWCPLPGIRRERSFWGKHKSFYAVSLYPMKPIKWVSIGFVAGFRSLLRQTIGYWFGMSQRVQFVLIDYLTRLLYGILAAGWWYFFAYTMDTGIIISRVIVPLNDVEGFPDKLLNYTIIYVVYLAVLSWCYSVWSASYVTSGTRILLRDSLCIMITESAVDSSTSNNDGALCDGAPTRRAILTTEWLKNYLRYASEKRRRAAFWGSFGLALFGFLVHVGIKVLLIVLGKKHAGGTIVLYHFSDIPGVKFPFFVVVGSLYAGSLFLLAFVSLDPLMKQNVAMKYMSKMLENTFHQSDFPGVQSLSSKKHEESGVPACCGFASPRISACFSRAFYSCRHVNCGGAIPQLPRLSLSDPLSIYAWLHTRQCLIKEFQDNFAEAKYVLLTSFLFIGAGLGYFIFEWIRTSSLFANSTVLTDALYGACVVVFLLNYASSLEDENQRQARLIGEAMLQIRQQEQADFSFTGMRTDVAESAEDRQMRLDHCYKAYEVSHHVIKEQPVVATILGIELSRRTVKSAMVGVGGLAIPVLKAVSNEIV
eukprot:gb/GECG01012488.1/.p1 GENE.gb/GECG01012488.1/~~gb/GECG01012488.1/.p1  ORF type:complete len:962 (+),score=86.30 gb/GECG01012488.1/:1-2886(+)